jgi:hypothetical protein
MRPLRPVGVEAARQVLSLQKSERYRYGVPFGEWSSRGVE